MNAIKRYAGLIWIILGPLGIHYLLQTASAEIAKKPGIHYGLLSNSYWFYSFWIVRP